VQFSYLLNVLLTVHRSTTGPTGRTVCVQFVTVNSLSSTERTLYKPEKCHSLYRFLATLIPERGYKTQSCFVVSGEYTSVWIPLQPAIQQVDDDGADAAGEMPLLAERRVRTAVRHRRR
jgi:hypothetical protein